MRQLLAALTVACLASLMQACGQTGPLYMPDETLSDKAGQDESIQDEAVPTEAAPTEAADAPITEPAD